MYIHVRMYIYNKKCVVLYLPQLLRHVQGVRRNNLVENYPLYHLQKIKNKIKTADMQTFYENLKKLAFKNNKYIQHTHTDIHI